MMWNWLASGIASGATLMLYDGSPFAPSPSVLWDYAQAERITLFGTSAKYIDSCKKEGLEPAKTHDLSSLRMIASTGSPLAPESFEYVYGAIKRDVHLASISGGTDIVSCFVLGDPTSPVWRGEIQAPGLGMAVDVWSEDFPSFAQPLLPASSTQPVFPPQRARLLGGNRPPQRIHEVDDITGRGAVSDCRSVGIVGLLASFP